ncbi:MAG: protein translocase subunit SecF, partial [Patescibacteria group bacterium]
ERPAVNDLRILMEELNFEKELVIQESGAKNVILRFQESNEDAHQNIVNKLKEKYPDNFQEEKFESIGSVVGSELKTKAIYSIIIVSIAIIIYIAVAFRKVTYPVASWKYGLFAIVALLHDVVITSGIFAVLGKFAGMEVGLPFVAALLTILGYSVNDTIVIFDRIRENLGRVSKQSFASLVNLSLNETMTRSINTTLTTLLSLVAIYLFGGESIKYFALALLIGIFLGAYSSIFVASPLLVVSEAMKREKK